MIIYAYLYKSSRVPACVLGHFCSHVQLLWPSGLQPTRPLSMESPQEYWVYSWHICSCPLPGNRPHPGTESYVFFSSTCIAASVNFFTSNKLENPIYLYNRYIYVGGVYYTNTCMESVNNILDVTKTAKLFSKLFLNFSKFTTRKEKFKIKLVYTIREKIVESSCWQSHRIELKSSWYNNRSWHLNTLELCYLNDWLSGNIALQFFTHYMFWSWGNTRIRILGQRSFLLTLSFYKQ